VVLALVAGLEPSCGSPDTVVLVGVQGTTSALGQLAVEATVGAETRSLHVPDPPGAPFFLPTNFTLQIPRAVTGTLRVTVTALDTAGRAIASGMGMIPLVAGKRNELTLTIGASAADGGPDDAGADAAPDAAMPDLPDAAEDRTDDAASVDAGTIDAGSDASIDTASDRGGDAAAGDGMPDGPSDAALGDARDGG